MVANCLCALQEILTQEGNNIEEVGLEKDFLMAKPIIYYLLNRLGKVTNKIRLYPSAHIDLINLWSCTCKQRQC